MDEALSPPSKRGAVPVNAGRQSWKVQVEQESPCGDPAVRQDTLGTAPAAALSVGNKNRSQHARPASRLFFCLCPAFSGLGHIPEHTAAICMCSGSLKGFHRELLQAAQSRVTTLVLGRSPFRSPWLIILKVTSWAALSIVAICFVQCLSDVVHWNVFMHRLI